MRKVKVYSTAFGLKFINSNATTWSELKSELTTNNISSDNMNAVENVNNTTLVLDDARLPEGEFVLMLTPIKTKSGNDYKVIRTAIVEIMNDFGDVAKAHFNAGKNYTNKSKDELASLLQQWNAKYSKTKSSQPTREEVKMVPVKEEKTPVKVKEEKPTFIQALKNLLDYLEILEWSDLESEIQNVLDEHVDDSRIELSAEEQAWLRKMKNM